MALFFFFCFFIIILYHLTAHPFTTRHHRLIKHPEQRPVDVEGPQ